MKPASLYLCYQSIAEPLTQTQVAAYLEGLAQAGYRMVLVTFEPRRLGREEEAEWRARLAAQGMPWHVRDETVRPGSAAVRSVTSPPGSDATATDQKKSCGLFRYGSLRRSGMSQRPLSRMSRASSM